jgi:hypothetical protein
VPSVFCPYEFPESRVHVAMNTGRRSHSNAVHFDARAVSYPPYKEPQIASAVMTTRSACSRFHFTRCAFFAPLITCLISTVSEYGFDIDLPLTPSSWVIITICAAVVSSFAKPSAARSDCACDSSNSRLCHVAAQADQFRPLQNQKPPAGRAEEIRAACLERSDLSLLAIQIPKDQIFRLDGIVSFLSFMSPANVHGPPQTNEVCSSSLLVPPSILGQHLTASPRFTISLVDVSSKNFTASTSRCHEFRSAAMRRKANNQQMPVHDSVNG